MCVESIEEVEDASDFCTEDELFFCIDIEMVHDCANRTDAIDIAAVQTILTIS